MSWDHFLQSLAGHTTADLKSLKATLKEYVLAWQQKNMDGLKSVTSEQLYSELSANLPASKQNFSIQPDLLEIRDLALYNFRNRLFAQFDIYDAKLKKISRNAIMV